jgi:hypothetical protein
MGTFSIPRPSLFSEILFSSKVHKKGLASSAAKDSYKEKAKIRTIWPIFCKGIARLQIRAR